MWAVIAPYLIKFAVSLAITLLERAGVISGLEAAGLRAGSHILQAVKDTKTYPEYPMTEGQKAAEALSSETTNVIGLTIGKNAKQP